LLFKDVIGNDRVKSLLLKNLEKDKISHCQLFASPPGCGSLPMALAYARKIITNNSPAPESCNKMLANLTHPDLHFIYPVINTAEFKSKAVSSNFLPTWRDFININPYGGIYDWYSFAGFENKQGKIGVDEAENLVKKMSLKSFKGGWKCAIIWMAETINVSATNKLLKLIEEPPEKTLFIFVAENQELILDTLTSRCLKIFLNNLTYSEIEAALVTKGISIKLAKKAAIVSGGSFSTALSFATNPDQNMKFEDWFHSWVRLAFRVKNNKESLLDLINWVKNISSAGRETQKSFLIYSLELFRQAFLTNFGLIKLVNHSSRSDFNFEKFSDYISSINIEDIYFEMEKAYNNIVSNGNSNMIFTDLSLKLTRLIHRN